MPAMVAPSMNKNFIWTETDIDKIGAFLNDIFQAQVTESINSTFKDTGI